jgi:hypothetical protein
MRRTIAVVIGALLLGALGVPAGAAGTWSWPVRGPIIRGFDPPASPYGAGHRGIDIAVPTGTLVVAPAPGIVSFAGRVAGQVFVSIDHGAGLVSTGSYLSTALVAKDDPVVAGQPVATSGPGHPGSAVEHLHFGVRLGGTYVDPLDYLGPLSLAGILWLAPIDAEVGTGTANRAGTVGLPGPAAVAARWRPSGGVEHGAAATASREPALSWASPRRGRPVPP